MLRSLHSNSEARDEPDDHNPYRSRVREFPGRLFTFEDDAADRAALAALVERSPELIVELGSGSGRHLIDLAVRHPEANCVGIELRYKRAVRTIEKAERQGVDRVYVLRTDGKQLVGLFPSSSIDTLHVNFPDPWEKRKRWKHRLLSTWLLEAARELLKPEGTLSVKTDHLDYFLAFRADVDAAPWMEVAFESRDLHRDVLHNGDGATGTVLTEFESLFCSQGLPIYHAKLRLRSK